MYWETLPSWVWLIYYLLIFTTLGAAIISVIQKKIVSLSIVTIVLTITVPITAINNSIGRLVDVNEFEHLISQLQQGSIWSIYVVLGYLYLLIYLVIFIKNKLNTEIA
ncbi:hypothetical protein GH741_02180 [Aquibacillus halophilus]|uniref:Uncharacterized protein n=1 Tax=Aquibacillus halophilus TaxID=930132 RepID=A0A6A8DC80_9BACI|nr:hypothetical protein [Aquibacillus halophilus]MRH41479.1 hypothetical protein [Aquibacillus halophilus]